jgi:hypothetical protein
MGLLLALANSGVYAAYAAAVLAVLAVGPSSSWKISKH